MPITPYDPADFMKEFGVQRETAKEREFAPTQRGFLGDTISLIGRAGVSTLETLENAAEFFNLDDDPASMTSKLRQFDIFKPDIDEYLDRGLLQKTWAGSIPEAFESAGPSLAVAGAGFLTGAALTPFMPFIGGTVGAAIASLGLMGSAEYQSTYEAAIAQGKSIDEAKDVAWKTGIIEGLGESAGSIIGLGFGKLPANMAIKGLTKFVKRPLGETLDKLTKVSMKDFATSLGQTYSAEQLTEFAQAFGQTEALRNADMTDVGNLEALAQTIIPTLFMTGGFQMATTGMNINEKRKLRAGLKSSNPALRRKALDATRKMLAMEDPELADKFYMFGKNLLDNNKPIDFNMKFAEFADELIAAHTTKVAASPAASTISPKAVLTGQVSEDAVNAILQNEVEATSLIKKNDIFKQFAGLAGARITSAEEQATADREYLDELEWEMQEAHDRIYKKDGTKKARVSAKAEARYRELRAEWEQAQESGVYGDKQALGQPEDAFTLTGEFRPTRPTPAGRSETITKGMLEGKAPKATVQKRISEQMTKPSEVAKTPEEDVVQGLRSRRDALNNILQTRQPDLSPAAMNIIVDQVVELDKQIDQMERALNIAPREKTAPTREELLAKEPGTLTETEQRQAYEERDRIDSELANPNLPVAERARLLGEYYQLAIVGQIPQGIAELTEEELTQQALAATPEGEVTPPAVAAAAAPVEKAPTGFSLTKAQTKLVEGFSDKDRDSFDRAMIRWQTNNDAYEEAKTQGNDHVAKMALEYRTAAENTMRLMLASKGDTTPRAAEAPQTILQSRQQALAVYKVLRDAVTTRFGKDKRPFTRTGMRGITQGAQMDIKEGTTEETVVGGRQTPEGGLVLTTKDVMRIGETIGKTGIEGLTDEELVGLMDYYDNLVGQLPSEKTFNPIEIAAMKQEFAMLAGVPELGERLALDTELGLEEATRMVLEEAKDEGGLSSSEFYERLSDMMGGIQTIKASEFAKDKKLKERKVDLPNKVIQWFHDEQMAVGNYRSTGYIGFPHGIKDVGYYLFQQGPGEYVIFKLEEEPGKAISRSRTGKLTPLLPRDEEGNHQFFKTRNMAAMFAEEHARTLGSSQWLHEVDTNGIVSYRIQPEGTEDVYYIVSATNNLKDNKWFAYKNGDVFMNQTPTGKPTANFIKMSSGQVRARVEELAGFETTDIKALNAANKQVDEAYEAQANAWNKKERKGAPKIMAATDFYLQYEPVVTLSESEARRRRETTKPRYFAGDKYRGQTMTPELRGIIGQEIGQFQDALSELDVESLHRDRFRSVASVEESARVPTDEEGRIRDEIASLKRVLAMADGDTIGTPVKKVRIGKNLEGKPVYTIQESSAPLERPEVTVPKGTPAASPEDMAAALADVEGLVERGLMRILSRGLGFVPKTYQEVSEMAVPSEPTFRPSVAPGVGTPVRPPQTPVTAIPTQPGQKPIALTQAQIDELRAQRTEAQKQADEEWEQNAGLFVLENLRRLEKQLGRSLRTADSETQVLDLLRRMSRGEMVDPGFIYDPEADIHILKPAPLDSRVSESVYYATVFYDAYLAQNPRPSALTSQFVPSEAALDYQATTGRELYADFGATVESRAGSIELSAFQVAIDEAIDNRNWEARQEIRRRIRAEQKRTLYSPPGIDESVSGAPTEATAGDIIRNMAASGNVVAKELLKKLNLDFLDMVPVEYNPNITRSYYDGKRDKIVLAGNVDQIKMHEALHAALAHHINSNPESAREIQKLMDAFAKQAEAMGLNEAQSVRYALKSVHEFMSQALSDPLTQTILEATPSKEAVTGLRALIRKIMKFFGFGPKLEGALADVVAMAGRISQESSHHRLMEIMRSAEPVDGYPQTVREALARLRAGQNEVHHYSAERVVAFDRTKSSILHFFAGPVTNAEKALGLKRAILNRFTISPNARMLEVKDEGFELHVTNILEAIAPELTPQQMASLKAQLNEMTHTQTAAQDLAVRAAMALGYDGIVYMNPFEFAQVEGGTGTGWPTFGVFHEGVLEPVEEQDSIYYAPEGEESLKKEKKEGYNLDLDEVDRKMQGQKPPTYKDFFKRIGTDIGKKVKNYFQVTSEQLRAIDEKYMHQLRQYEFRAMRKTREQLRLLEPFIMKLNQLSNQDYNRLHYFFLNPNTVDEKTGKTLHQIGLEFLKKRGMLKEWESVQAILDDIERRADAVGYRFHRLPRYIPRLVKDYAGLRDFLINRAIATGDKAGLAFLHSLKKRASKLSEDEQKALWVSAVMKGSIPGVPQPKSVKTRSLNSVPLEAVQFYGRLEDALLEHVFSMNDRIEQRVTVGAGYLKRARLSKQIRRLDAERKRLQAIEEPSDDETKRLTRVLKAINKKEASYDALPEDTELYNSLTDKLLEDESLTPEQRLHVAKLFNARFRQTGMSGVMQELKNVGLMMTLGNPLSAITQIADQALNIYMHGNVFKGNTHAFRGMFQAMSDKEFLNQMELDKSLHEFALGDTTRLLDKILTASGLKAMDLYGKNAFMLAAKEMYSEMSLEKFKEKWGAPGLLQDAEAAWRAFQEGKVSENEDALYVLYSDLADVQPINLSELPPGYLEMKNGRILYMLKSFAIKQVNNIVRESVYEWENGNKQKAVLQTASLITLLSLSGAGTDEIKDIILGREKAFSDHVTDNLFQLVLMSKFNFDKGMRQGNLTQAIATGFLPPTRYIDDMISDIGGFIDGDPTYKSLRNVPIGGRIVYSRFTEQGIERELSMFRQDILKEAREGRNMSSEIQMFNRKRRELSQRGRENVKAITADTLRQAREAERKKQLGLQ